MIFGRKEWKITPITGAFVFQYSNILQIFYVLSGGSRISQKEAPTPKVDVKAII